MNADALIGMVLGTCTLQKLIGQGGMGAVFLAQQSRPKRQVAVKVLLPMSPLAPNQRTAFLERFRRETDVVASLEHPNIMPVHEYGERDGLAYLVMPYISGGTLRDELEREGRLPLEKAVLYLEQLAAALELAHEHGVIHRDIKPANILVRREGRLLLTDFGLVKIVSEGQGASSRLTGVGVPLGTPDYMAPEQVMGGEIDARADLYSLGIILYQMVTGTVPFKANMPMQVAMQHMQSPPPSPRALRRELPPAAEQVILRALAKRPDERYKNVQEFASAFRLSLITSGVPLPDFSGMLAPGGLTDVNLFTPRSLFDPLWQGPSTENGTGVNGNMLANAAPQASLKQRNEPRKDIIGKTSIPMPSLTTFMPPNNTPLPPMANVQPASVQAAKSASPLPGRPVLGHKFNLRRPSGDLEQQPFMPSSPQRDEQHLQDVQPAPTNLSGFALPPEGSDLRPAPIMPAQRPGLLSSFSPEKSGLRPSPGRLLGRSSLRPMGPMTLAGSGVQPLPSIPTEATDEHPFASFPAENTGTPLFPPPNTNWTAESVAPLQSMDKQTNAGSGMEAFNSPSVFPSTAGVPTGSTIQPLDGSPVPTFNGSTTQLPGNPVTQQLGASATRQLTGALVMGNVGMSNTNTGNTGMMKLAQAAKVVQVPIAGQPGRYVTGLLPVLEQQKTSLPPPIAKKVAAVDVLLKGRLKLIALIAVVALVVFSSFAFFLAQSHNGSTANGDKKATGQNGVVTATVNAVATGDANVIVKDALDGNGGNIHNLLLGRSSGSLYAFKNNAYHITVNSPNAAIALLPNASMLNSSTYTLTMEAIKGDETGANGINSFGMIFCFNQLTIKNKKVTTFYTLQVINVKNGEYQFWKYDSSRGVGNEWVKLWHGNFGKEFHQGHGPRATNTFNVFMKNGSFTFTVNGKSVRTVKDKSLQSGGVGMIVNLNGTEVAFSNLLLTSN
jgi:eukaryotic-like serine/threonine-protein kinase